MVVSQYCPTQKICGLRKKSKKKRELVLNLLERESKYYCTALEDLGYSQDSCAYVFELNRDLARDPVPKPEYYLIGPN